MSYTGTTLFRNKFRSVVNCAYTLSSCFKRLVFFVLSVFTISEAYGTVLILEVDF